MIHQDAHAVSTTDTLAERLAAFAAGRRPLDGEVAAMASLRVLDSLGAMLAADSRAAPARARSIAATQSRPGGAGLVGAPPDLRVACQWAAFSNGVALRELDLGDMYVGADYARPSDTIPPLLAVAQQCRRSSSDLLRGIAVAYEAQLALARAIPLHTHGVSPVAHLGPAVAAGLGALLDARPNAIAHAVGAIAQLSFISRQGLPGSRSDWRTFAPATIGRLAIEAMDYALRGGRAPDAIFEHPSGPFATFLGAGIDRSRVQLPGPDEPCRAILDSFPKAHSAQFQSQVLIDLALRIRAQKPDLESLVRVDVRTSEHLHRAVGSSWRDARPGKAPPRPDRGVDGARIIAAVLRNGSAPLENESQDFDPLETRVRTIGSDEWSSRSHHADPEIQCFGAEMTVEFSTGKTLSARLERPDAHRLGERPWGPIDYLGRFRKLTSFRIPVEVQDRIIEESQALVMLPAIAMATLELGGASPGGAPTFADTIL